MHKMLFILCLLSIVVAAIFSFYNHVYAEYWFTISTLLLGSFLGSISKKENNPQGADREKDSSKINTND